MSPLRMRAKKRLAPGRASRGLWGSGPGFWAWGGPECAGYIKRADTIVFTNFSVLFASARVRTKWSGTTSVPRVRIFLTRDPRVLVTLLDALQRPSPPAIVALVATRQTKGPKTPRTFARMTSLR